MDRCKKSLVLVGGVRKRFLFYGNGPSLASVDIDAYRPFFLVVHFSFVEHIYFVHTLNHK